MLSIRIFVTFQLSLNQNFPLQITVNLIKFPDIVKLKTCQLFYDLIVDNKPSNLTLSFVSEQQNYTTRSTPLQYLNHNSLE